MPRKVRFFVANVPVHIVQRGHSRGPVFFEAANYQAYLRWLKEGALRYRVDIHAYALMTNHIHLLVTPSESKGVTRMMQYVGRYYVPYINGTNGTSGSIWEGRYKASLIHDEEYLLTCMRYIELNPVRANMARYPEDYQWSSYRYNGQGTADALVTPHALYKALGKNRESRVMAYQALFPTHLGEQVLNKIRAAWQTGTPLGNDIFREKIESILKCKVGQARRGRPSKKKCGDD
jgi:putative transposase